MTKLRRYFLLLIGITLAFFTIGVVSLTVGNVGEAKSSVVSSEVAVAQALLYAKDDGHFGGFTELPTEIRGQLMTYNQAVQAVFDRSIDINEGIYSIKDYPVWFIALGGTFIEHVPGTPDIPAKDVIHSQMVIILDGNTAEALEVILISPQKELVVDTVPLLPVPLNESIDVPTKAPIIVVTPMPTSSQGTMEEIP